MARLRSGSRLAFRIVWSGFALLGIALTVAVTTPVTGWYAMALARASGWQGGDYPAAVQNATVILLAGSGGPLDRLGYDSMIRCNRALIFWHTGRVQRIIVSGVGVAAAMRDYLIDRGVPTEAITVEPHATSTHQNALLVRALLPPGQTPLVLVTSDYHMLRASCAFRRAGVQLQPVIAWDAYEQAVNRADRPSAIFTEVLESFKIVYYSARGWM